MIKEYINDNKDRFLSELFELLKIDSVSADSKFKEEVDKAANWLVDEFNKLELDNVEKIQTKGHPIVFAEKIFSLDQICCHFSSTVLWLYLDDTFLT